MRNAKAALFSYLDTFCTNEISLIDFSMAHSRFFAFYISESFGLRKQLPEFSLRKVFLPFWTGTHGHTR